MTWSKFFNHPLFRDNKPNTGFMPFGSTIQGFNAVNNRFRMEGERCAVPKNMGQEYDDNMELSTIEEVSMTEELKVTKVEEEYIDSNQIDQFHMNNSQSNQYQENENIYIHEKNKVRFIRETCEHLRNLGIKSIGNPYTNSVVLTYALLSKKAKMFMDFNFQNLCLLKQNTFNLPSFDQWINSPSSQSVKSMYQQEINTLNNDIKLFMEDVNH